MTPDQPENKTRRTRNGKGRFDRNPVTAERDAEAARLRARSLTYREIGEQLGLTVASAYEAVQRALRDTLTEPAADVRELELRRLDEMWAAVLAVLERDHLTVSHGKVITIDGEPLKDDGPVLSAVDRLLKIQERRAKLLGLDSAEKVTVS